MVNVDCLWDERIAACREAARKSPKVHESTIYSTFTTIFIVLYDLHVSQSHACMQKIKEEGKMGDPEKAIMIIRDNVIPSLKAELCLPGCPNEVNTSTSLDGMDRYYRIRFLFLLIHQSERHINAVDPDIQSTPHLFSALLEMEIDPGSGCVCMRYPKLKSRDPCYCRW